MSDQSKGSVARYWSLREQAEHLRSPNRRGGPSRYEAEECAAQIDAEANELSESMFYETVKQDA